MEVPAKDGPGPELYSFWYYNDTPSHSDYCTVILQVTSWSRYGGSSVECVFFMLNGSTNNSGYVNHELPEHLKHLSIEEFWQMVEDNKLILLKPSPGEFVVAQGIFKEGDVVTFTPS